MSDGDEHEYEEHDEPLPRGVQKLNGHAAASSYSWMRPPTRSRRLT
jgi:hypothetical protein